MREAVGAVGHARVAALARAWVTDADADGRHVSTSGEVDFRDDELRGMKEVLGMAGFMARLRERRAKRKAARAEARKRIALDSRQSLRDAHEDEATRLGERGPTSGSGSGG